MPLVLHKWDFSERHARRVVDWCVNQGLALWEISWKGGDDPVAARHWRTPLGDEVLAMRDKISLAFSSPTGYAEGTERETINEQSGGHDHTALC